MQIEGKPFPTKRSASAQKLVPLPAPLPEESCYAKTYFYYSVPLLVSGDAWL